MIITEIIASYEAKQNVGDYSNVMPHLTVTATLNEGDDADLVMADVLARARHVVEAAVDDALEANDRPAVYSPAPRYRIAVRHNTRADGLPKIVVLVEGDTPLPASFSDYMMGFRLPAARRIAGLTSRVADSIFVDTTLEPDALAPLLEQVAAEEAAIKAERAREFEERIARYEAARRRDADDDADDDAA